MKKELIEFISHNKVITICRGVYGQDLVNLVEALYAGGIKLVEVTFDQSEPDPIVKTAEAITLLNSHFKSRVRIGAGTVLNIEQVNAAYQAGAEYIISPNTNEQVIKETVRLGLVSIPGALTPSEVANAHDWGADFIKLFPAGTLGLKYAKDIMAPLNHVKYLATAGIDEATFKSFMDLGFAGAGVSGRLTEKKLIKAGNFAEFTQRAQAFTDIAQQYHA